MDTLYIVIPAYNEAENIENCIMDWYPVVERHSGNGQSRLVIIDDGSKDNTYDIIKKCAETRPLLIPLTKQNGGHGSAVLSGYRYATKQGADYIFQTDSDGQTNPAEFEQFWEDRENYDAIIGTRPERGDGKTRKFVEDVVCIILRLVFGVTVKDANAPYRLMQHKKLADYIDKLPENFNIPNIMLTTYYMHYKDRVRFINISFKPREKGTASINVKKIIGIGFKAVKDFYMLKREM